MYIDTYVGTQIHIYMLIIHIPPNILCILFINDVTCCLPQTEPDSYLCLLSLKDWDYLLASNYHRQINSQPVCGPVDSSSSNTDTDGLSMVSNSLWVDRYFQLIYVVCLMMYVYDILEEEFVLWRFRCLQTAQTLWIKVCKDHVCMTTPTTHSWFCCIYRW